jgi:putative transposase
MLRFCGYVEVAAGVVEAKKGLIHIWGNHGVKQIGSALRVHRMLFFGKHTPEPGLPEMTRKGARKVLDQGDGHLPRSVRLRCQVRYFTDEAILGLRGQVFS